MKKEEFKSKCIDSIKLKYLIMVNAHGDGRFLRAASTARCGEGTSDLFKNAGQSIRSDYSLNQMHVLS